MAIVRFSILELDQLQIFSVLLILFQKEKNREREREKIQIQIFAFIIRFFETLPAKHCQHNCECKQVTRNNGELTTG